MSLKKLISKHSNIICMKFTIKFHVILFKYSVVHVIQKNDFLHIIFLHMYYRRIILIQKRTQKTDTDNTHAYVCV